MRSSVQAGFHAEARAKKRTTARCERLRWSDKLPKKRQGGGPGLLNFHKHDSVRRNIGGEFVRYLT